MLEKRREIFKKFLEWEEYKLKRSNRLSSLDEPTYKTLCYYVSRLQTVNRWFKNVNWVAIPGKDLFFDGGLGPYDVLDQAHFDATAQRALELGWQDMFVPGHGPSKAQKELAAQPSGD